MRILPQLAVMIVASLALMAGGAWAVQREFEIFQWDRSSPAGQIDSIINQTEPALALTSRREILLTCNALMDSLYARLEGEERAAQLLDRCGDMAREIAMQEQANSLAWAVDAKAAGLRGEFAGMNQSLLRSHATGPNDQWLAAIRFDTAERFIDAMTPETARMHDADILLMLDSDLAIDALVQRYLVYADFRDRLVTLVETLPPERQRAFVADVRRISTRLQGDPS